jgi:hypothetical protein
MKNKWIKSILLMVLGFVSYNIGGVLDGGIVGNLLTIVGVILFIAGIVEVFKKKKADDSVANHPAPQL